MNRFGFGSNRHINDPINTQIGFACRRRSDVVRFVRVTHVQRIAIYIGIDRNGLQSQFTARAQHTHRNFASIRY